MTKVSSDRMNAELELLDDVINEDYCRVMVVPRTILERSDTGRIINGSA